MELLLFDQGNLTFGNNRVATGENAMILYREVSLYINSFFNNNHAIRENKSVQANTEAIHVHGDMAPDALCFSNHAARREERHGKGRKRRMFKKMTSGKRSMTKTHFIHY